MNAPAPPRPLRHVGIGIGRMRSWHAGGLSEFAQQLGHGLARHAAQVREVNGLVLHFHLPRAFHGEFGTEVGYLDTPSYQRFVHLQTTRFDLWHCLHQHNRLGAPWGTLQRVETIHDLNFLYDRTPRKIAKYRARVGRRLRRADAAVAITHFVAAEIRRAIDGPLPPLHVIHNGAADLSGQPQDAVPGLLPQTFLFHLSRLAPNKNVKAMLALAEAWPEQAVVFAGPRSVDTDQLQAQVQAQGLRNVQVLLNISEAQKAWLYANCRGFLFPSLAEGFGLPPIEAMNFGKPVFLSRLTCLPEVGGKVAYYFDHFDGPAMRQVVESGLAHHDRMGQAEATRAHAGQFNWQRCADQYLGLYLQMLGLGTRG